MIDLGLPELILLFAFFLLPVALFAALTIWAVRTVTSSRQESARAATSSNELVVESLRTITERLDRIERQLSDVPG